MYVYTISTVKTIDTWNNKFNEMVICFGDLLMEHKYFPNYVTISFVLPYDSQYP